MKHIRDYLTQNAVSASFLTVGHYLAKRWIYLQQDHLPRQHLGAAFEQLRDTGIATVQNFIPTHACEQLRNKIDDFTEKHPQYVRTDDTNSDHRILGAEAAIQGIERFNENRWLKTIAEFYLGEDVDALFTMANRVDFVPGNLGSGGGWHRDTFGRQFKALLYLSDVGPENGPFQYIKHSYRIPHLVRDIWNGKLAYNQTRIPDEAAQRIISDAPDRLQTVTGPAGTLILVNTSGIHRGAPIKEGTRYALTNYYFEENQDRDQLLAHLPPILGQTASLSQ